MFPSLVEGFISDILKKGTKAVVDITLTWSNDKKYHSHNNESQKEASTVVLPSTADAMYNTLQVCIVVHSGVDCTNRCKNLGMRKSEYMNTSLSYKVKSSIFHFIIFISL